MGSLLRTLNHHTDSKLFSLHDSRMAQISNNSRPGSPPPAHLDYSLMKGAQILIAHGDSSVNTFGRSPSEPDGA